MDYLRVTTAAAYIGYGREQIYALARAGRIGRRIAGYWVFTHAELDRYVAERALEPRGRKPAKAGKS